MATNKKKVLITESFSKRGRDLFKDRDDIELVEFPNMISAGDFEAMLKQQAPVHGVALGATKFGEPEIPAPGARPLATRRGGGYDAGDVSPPTRRQGARHGGGAPGSPIAA